MIVLALDTTAKTAAAALVRWDATERPETATLIAATQRNDTRTHSETLLPAVEQLLAHASLTMQDVGLIGVSAGPGSFTGVRIGVALVKGLAFGSDLPCVGVSTLEALAFNLYGCDGETPRLVCPAMDARRDQFYTALFCGGKRLTEDACLSAGELAELLTRHDRGQGIVLVGDGARPAAALLKEAGLAPSVAPELLLYQNAYSVAVTAARTFSDHKENEYRAADLKPVYLRLPQAERERRERMNQHDN